MDNENIRDKRKIAISENALSEFRGGFVLLPYHLANAAQAIEKLIYKAIEWLTTEH